VSQTDRQNCDGYDAATRKNSILSPTRVHFQTRKIHQCADLVVVRIFWTTACVVFSPDSNGRTYGTVVVCRLSVTDVLWLSGRSYEKKLFAKATKPLSRLFRIRFCGSSLRRTFSNSWLNRGSRKICFFNGKLVIARKRWKIGPRLLLVTNRKSHIDFQMTWKSLILDDVEGHWQPVLSAILETAGFFCYVSSRDNV